MGHRELDAWFARADDVLRDWSGSADSMEALARPDDADPELPLLGDNGADQTWPLRRPRARPTSRAGRIGSGARAARTAGAAGVVNVVARRVARLVLRRGSGIGR